MSSFYGDLASYPSFHRAVAVMANELVHRFPADKSTSAGQADGDNTPIGHRVGESIMRILQ